MASFDVCYAWMQSNEDSADLHATVLDKCPASYKGKGPCFAISGVNSGAWPDEFAAIQRLQQDERGPAVEAFYHEHFWNRWYAQLTSDEVAKRVFDAAVNMGSVAAVRCLQEAVLSLWTGETQPYMAVDGQLGPATVSYVNACQDSALVPAFQQARIAHYGELIAKNPALAIYKAVWTARAER